LRFELRIVRKDIAGLIVGATEFARTKPPRFLRPGEIERVFENLSFDGKKSCRQSAMVHLAFSLGLRPKEICSVLLDDISFERGAIVIAKRKCDNPVELPLPEAAIKAVAAYIIGARPDSRHRHLFLALTAPYSPLSVQRASAEITAALKPVNPEATAYWLRHTYAQNMLSAGADIFEVKEMMGHDRIQSTRRYLQIDLQSMRKLFDD
jgi:site-specific recombinase XerD